VLDALAHRRVHLQARDGGRGTHCGSDDSLLGRSTPPTGRAVKTIENSCRTSLLLV
jgi:hypothetical protein